MPYALSKVTEQADFNKVIALELEAYKQPLNTFVEIMRGPTVEETQERQWQWYQGTPGSHWIKVVDSETGEVVGGAEWVVYEKNPYAEPGPEMAAYWWPQDNVLHTMANQILGTFMGQRPARMSRPHVLLNICFVKADRRRTGVGKMLVQYGVDLADKLSLDTFIEATEDGKALYEHMGFHTVDHFFVDVHSDSPTPEWTKEQQRIAPQPFKIWFMWKPADGKYVEGQTIYPWEMEAKTAVTS